LKVKDYFDDDDDDDDYKVNGRMNNVNVKQSDRQDDVDDMDDPLDSFMSNIQQEIQQQQHQSSEAISTITRQQKLPDIVSGGIEDYEDYEDYGQPTVMADGDDIDDDDPSTTTTGGGVNGSTKARIEPLPPIDHSVIVYKPFRRDFYSSHIPSEIASLNDEEVEDLLHRSELSIQSYKVSRQSLPRPISSFKQTGFDHQLLKEISSLGFDHPTPIQSLAIPTALTGYDLIALAKTGSGKTFAYLWPLIMHIIDQPQMELGEGPIGLVLVPTRELATQVYMESKKFTKCYNIRAVPIYGGAGKYEMTKALKEAPEMVIATPGRLIEMVQNKSTNLRRCTMVVLDEADRMFEMGFEYQVRSIISNIRPDKQILMFSATMKKKIEGFAKEICRNEVRVVVGKTGQANADIQQIAYVMPHDTDKWVWLSNNIDLFASEGKVLIFVLQKQDTEALVSKLKALFQARQLFISVDCLHGDKDQSDRMRIMAQYRVVVNSKSSSNPDCAATADSMSASGKTSLTILVATDIAARGLDVKDIRTVINYDVAKNIETYIHRIGRTGRLGVEGVTPGTAYTLLTNKDSSFAVDLVQNLNLSKQMVGKELQALAESDSKWARIKHIQFGGGGMGHNSSNNNSNSSGSGSGSSYSGSNRSKGVGRGGLGFGRTPAVAMTSAMLANQWDRAGSGAPVKSSSFSESVRPAVAMSASSSVSKSSADEFAANPYLEGRSQGRGKHLTQPSWVNSASAAVGTNSNAEATRLSGGAATDDRPVIIGTSTATTVVHADDTDASIFKQQHAVKRKSRFADLEQEEAVPTIRRHIAASTMLPGFVRSSSSMIPSSSSSIIPPSLSSVAASAVNHYSNTACSRPVLPGFVRSTAPSTDTTAQADPLRKRSRWDTS
jgi:ATP-dependent RNA helicase DDX42